MDKLIGLTPAESEKQLQEDIIKAIKELETPQERFQAVALSHYYEQKKLLDKELEKKIRELTLEFDLKSKPLLEKQNEIISGRAITQDELTLAKEYLSEEDQKQTETVLQQTGAIKEYWLRAMLNNDIMVEEIKEKDEDLLKYLTRLEYEAEAGTNNFILKFHFTANEYFTNEILTKKFYITEDDEVTKTEGTEIKWKEGKNLTVKTVKKTQKNKKTGAKRTVTKEVQDESFFNFFKDGENEPADQGDDEEGDPEQGTKIQIDQDIGRTLVEEIIPYSVEYFLGVKEPEGDDYDDEGIDEEEVEDEEEEEEKPKNKKKDKKQHKKSCDSHDSNKKGGDSGKGGDASKPGEKPECKQQ